MNDRNPGLSTFAIRRSQILLLLVISSGVRGGWTQRPVILNTLTDCTLNSDVMSHFPNTRCHSSSSYCTVINNIVMCWCTGCCFIDCAVHWLRTAHTHTHTHTQYCALFVELIAKIQRGCTAADGQAKQRYLEMQRAFRVFTSLSAVQVVTFYHSDVTNNFPLFKTNCNQTFIKRSYANILNDVTVNCRYKWIYYCECTIC
jgi:hypothetical protein